MYNQQFVLYYNFLQMPCFKFFLKIDCRISMVEQKLQRYFKNFVFNIQIQLEFIGVWNHEYHGMKADRLSSLLEPLSYNLILGILVDRHQYDQAKVKMTKKNTMIWVSELFSNLNKCEFIGVWSHGLWNKSRRANFPIKTLLSNDPDFDGFEQILIRMFHCLYPYNSRILVRHAILDKTPIV